ncbi:MAG: glycosyltransferase [Planctomycetota bacterium]
MEPESARAVIVSPTELWAHTSSQAARMAGALWRIGCEVLFLECGGGETAFGKRTRGCTALAGGVFAHPERERYFVARPRRLPFMRYSFPDFARAANERRASRAAARFIASRATDRDTVVVHYGWYFPGVLSREAARVVYECLDDHTAAPVVAKAEWRRRYVLEVESRLLARADVSVFSSPRLAEARGPAARRSEVLPLGVDVEHFSRSAANDPHEARGIARPRVGFVGLVTAREDWAAVARASELAPDIQWVVVGPGHGVARGGPPNLHWIGEVDYADLPAWLGGWDAGVVPFADTDFNRGSWPLKFYEYLAAGLPVASTPIPAAAALADETKGLVVAAGGWGPKDILRAVRRALRETGRARTEGPAFAANHSWTARARRLLSLV